MGREDESSTNESTNSEEEDSKNALQNLEFKVLSTFAKIPTFFQGILYQLQYWRLDILSPSARRPSFMDEQSEKITDLLLAEWERSSSFPVKVDYNNLVNSDDSFEMQVYKQVTSND